MPTPRHRPADPQRYYQSDATCLVHFVHSRSAMILSRARLPSALNLNGHFTWRQSRPNNSWEVRIESTHSISRLLTDPVGPRPEKPTDKGKGNEFLSRAVTSSLLPSFEWPLQVQLPISDCLRRFLATISCDYSF
jgi:hypothetical protein